MKTTVISVWWRRNRNAILLIPAFIGIIIGILESTNYPQYQVLIVSAAVATAFALPGLAIAYGTITGWKDAWLEVTIPQYMEPIFLPYYPTQAEDSEILGPNRFEKPIYLKRLENFDDLFPGVGDVDMIKVRSTGPFHERTKSRTGLVFNMGMPVVNSNVIRLQLAPVAADIEKVRGKLIRVPTFELIDSIDGDYEMMTHPEVQDAMWGKWREILARRKKEMRME